jgi:V8-like Glu-specific endopeptidase
VSPLPAGLEVAERQELVAILAQLYDFTEGARARRVLIEAAGLRRFVPGIDLSGGPTTVAADLVGRLELFGPLPERPTHHALGALLSYVLTLSDLPPDRAARLARLIVVHDLVGDPAYVAQLRAAYGVAAPSAAEPRSDVTRTPAPRTSDIAEPAFDAALGDETALERVITSEDNFLDIDLLVGALYSALAVCRIENPEGTAAGTGFLIGPDLVLTNQHVLKSREWLEEAVARFDHRLETGGVATPGRTFTFRSDFYYSSPDVEFDYVLARLKAAPLESVAVKDASEMSMMDMLRAGKHRGYLVPTPRFLKAHDRVNVIQHPGTDPMKVVLTQNYVVSDMTDTRVQYVADTMNGSSGSPVFNQHWEVVALHHSGAPHPPDTAGQVLKKIWKGRYRVNEGIPMRGLLRDLRDKNLERHLPRS